MICVIDQNDGLTNISHWTGRNPDVAEHCCRKPKLMETVSYHILMRNLPKANDGDNDDQFFLEYRKNFYSMLNARTFSVDICFIFTCLESRGIAVFEVTTDFDFLVP